MKCALCNGDEKLVRKYQERTFRKEVIKINEHYYKCDKCKEEYTTTKIDNLNIAQIYNQYRAKYKIPFPDQITQLRENYGLSAARMSEILGFGINQYGKYEKGEIPNSSNATLLNLIKVPTNFKSLLAKKRDLFTDAQFSKAIARIDQCIQEENNFDIKNLYWSSEEQPNEFNGFIMPSYKKLFNIVTYFVANNQFYKVRLNKLLFYSDFLNFKKTGNSISGSNYVALQMGPVLNNYDIALGIMQSEGLLDEEFISFSDSNGALKLVNKINFIEDLCSDIELETLSTVLNKFKGLDTRKIVNLSHKELGWIKQSKNKGIISYNKYAFDLLAV